jgi:hypothetical protein
VSAKPSTGTRVCPDCGGPKSLQGKRCLACRKQPRRDPLVRLMEKVSFAATGCWEWTGSVNDSGYGKFSLSTTQLSRRAHRVAYELLVGPIPDGLELDHLCRNTICVNPAHLEPVTQAENVRRGLNAQKTHCAHGHEFTLENTGRHRSTGWRFCLACRRERDVVRAARRKAERHARRAEVRA